MGACKAVDISRSTFYRRWKQQDNLIVKKQRKRGSGSKIALSEEEREKIVALLHSEKYMDKSPSQVYASLLDEGVYICSIRTMYRILEQEDEVVERRRQKSRSHYVKPELLAEAPNQVWTWDITKLKGPEKWKYFQLYVIMDIFSRYVVGWTLSERESGELAKQLIEETCEKQNIGEGELIIHSDRGSAMQSKTVAQLYADLGIVKSLSRPSVSNDNPFIESQFKTLKYCPQFPERFGCIADARSFCREFFAYYNNEHYHSGISLLSPATVHYKEADIIIQRRQQVLNEVYIKNPERFVNKPPQPKAVPKAVWINPPALLSDDDVILQVKNNSKQ